MSVIDTVTHLGNLSVLLALVGLVGLWLFTFHQYCLLSWWLLAVALCIGSTAALKVYFYACPPLPDLHSPSGHTSLSTLVYGTLTLAVAKGVVGWRRNVAVAIGACVVLAIAISRLLLKVHSGLEVAFGFSVGLATLLPFVRKCMSNNEMITGDVRPLILGAVVLMITFDSQELRAEKFLQAISAYLNHVGVIACS